MKKPKFKQTNNPFLTMYDPLNDTICADKIGSLMYLHEEGHRVWFMNGTEQTLQMWTSYVLIMAVFSLAFKNYYFAQILVIVMIFLWQSSEVYAWIYAIKKRWG